MDDKTLTLTEVQNGVRKLTQFEQRKEDLVEMVALSAQITVPDVSNKEQVALAKAKRIELRKVEIDIEKQGKGYRGVFNSVNKEISAKEKELLKITTPEIERLIKIEEEAEKLALMEKREAMLPVRKERLLGVDSSGCYICEDKHLREMDADAFEKYYNESVANKNERDRVEAQFEDDKKRIEDQKKIDEEREQLEAEKKAEQDRKDEENRKEEERAEATRLAKEEEEKKAQEIENARREGLLPERKKSLEAIGDNVPILEDRLMLAMDDNEYTTYYNNRVTSKNEADKKAIEEKEKKDNDEKAEQKRLEKEAIADQQRAEKEERERREQMQKREDYKQFLKELGWTKEDSDKFHTIETETTYEVYRRVGVFKK